jgi:lysophospholipid acyltransferase (LPLAT)-like uncharacterized protein
MSANKLFKRFFKTAGFRTFVCWLIATYIRFVYYTSRVRIETDEATKPYLTRAPKPAVYAFWHGRLLMMPMVNPPSGKMHVLISSHRDGELIARTMHHFGFLTPRGSSSQGGITAAMQSVKALQAGDNVSITPDGPRGPAMKIQPGILSVAELAGVPIIPVCYSSTRHKRMRSWDKFMLALPFGKIYYKIGAPMMNPTKEELEKAMMYLVEEVDSKL